MTVSGSMCGTPVITRLPASIVRRSSWSTGLQQPALVSSLRRGLSPSKFSRRMEPSTSTSTPGGLLGLAGSLRWRSKGTGSSTTCMAQAGSPGSPAGERSSLVSDWQGRHAKAAGTSAAAAAALSTAAPPSTDDVNEAAGADASSFASPALGGTVQIDDVKLVHKVRYLLFHATTIVLAAILFSVLLIIHPLVLAFDKQRRTAHHIGTEAWAIASSILFCKTEIEGLENLPAADAGAVVYVANHQSSLDIYPLYQINRPFKFVSKTVNYRIPFIGGLMHLNDYIPVDPTSTKSQVLCLKKCMKMVREGISLMIFPEGTRAEDGALGVFKKGAFSVAAKEGVPVVPITLIGTSKLMPKGCFILRSGSIKMVVHPPIHSKSANELCEQSRKAIAETLIKHGMPVHDPVLV